MKRNERYYAPKYSLVEIPEPTAPGKRSKVTIMRGSTVIPGARSLSFSILRTIFLTGLNRAKNFPGFSELTCAVEPLKLNMNIG